MKILNDLEQNSPEWFQAKYGCISSSRIKNVRVEKILNKTDVINYLLEKKEKELNKEYYDQSENDVTLEIDEKIIDKKIKKELTDYKKEISRLDQRSIEALAPQNMYEEGFTSSAKKEYYRLLAERLGYFDDELEDPRDRGHRLEDQAVKALEEKVGVTARVVGMVKRDDYEHISLSPDALILGPTVGGDEWYEGGIEIKSPGVVNHLEIWKTNKIPSEYWWQVIQYFVVAEVEYVYFVSYNPIVKECPLIVIKVNKEDVIKDIEASLSDQINIDNHLEKDIERLTF